MRRVLAACGAVVIAGSLLAALSPRQVPLDEPTLLAARGGAFGECKPTGTTCDTQPGDGCTGVGDNTCLYCSGVGDIADLYCDGWAGLCGLFDIGCGWVTIGTCVYDTDPEPPTFAPYCLQNGTPSELECAKVQGCWHS